MVTNNYQRIRFLPAFILLFIIFIPFLPGCSSDSKDRSEYIASVNNETIKLEDFQREMALRSKQNPAYSVTPAAINQQLQTVIDRRLMVQEAMELGLASNDEFVRTIQTFWEQTLIRELIDAKSEEWEGRLYVTEKEIEDYYKIMQHRITLKIMRVDNKSEADAVLESAGKGDFLNWTTLGPLTFNDASSGALRRAFEMSEGLPEIYEDEMGIMVMLLETKEVVEVPPFEELHGSLKKDILQKKKTDALTTWLKEVKEKAVIEVNTDLVDALSEVNNQKNRAHQPGNDGSGDDR